MGLFNGTNVSVEAILTTRGRELLSKDSGKLNITKYLEICLSMVMLGPLTLNGKIYFVIVWIS